MEAGLATVFYSTVQTDSREVGGRDDDVNEEGEKERERGRERELRYKNELRAAVALTREAIA